MTVNLKGNLEAEIARSAGVRAALKAEAEQAAAAARAVAPVASGAYRDSIHVEPTDEGFQVVADVGYAGIIEFGSSDTPTFAPLRRGAEAAGLDLRQR